MKRTWNIRARLTAQILVMSLLSLTVLAVVGQLRLDNAMKESLNGRIMAGLERSNRSLTLTLEKYHTLLYDLCTDDDLIEMVENYNLGVDKEQMKIELRRELKHICNSNEGVLGLAVFTQDGGCVYYDGLSSSSLESQWISADMNHMGEGIEEYLPTRYAMTMGDEVVYQFSIQRRLVDYRDIHRELGSLMICVDEDILQECMDEVEGEFFCVVLDGKFVSTPWKNLIGHSQERLKVDGGGRRIRGNYQTASIENTESGWSVVEYYPLDRYLQTIREQTQVLFLMMLVLGLVMAGSVVSVTRPVIRSVESLMGAMQQVEQGDFTAHVEPMPDMPGEMLRIIEGFNEMVRRTDELLCQVRQATLEQKNAEISALEAQIDPHFLYNTLDTINWKAISREEYEISEMVGDLADILRYAIKNAGGVTTLGQEVAWLKKYLHLQQEKLGRRVQVFCDVSKQAAACRMHKLLLQPFVENSIAHGLPGSEKEAILLITGSVAEGQLHISVRDNGRGVDAQQLEELNREDYHRDNHFGVENVRKRLRLYYGEKASVSFFSVPGEYLEVTLRLPALEEGQDENSNSGG